MKQKSEKQNRGRTIVGICILLCSVLIIIYGGKTFPLSIGNIDFMSMTVGGLVGVVIGLCMIPGLNVAVKRGSVLLLGVIVSAYCFLFEMDPVFKLMSAVCIMGAAFVIVLRISGEQERKDKIRICKRCSAVSSEKLEEFARKNGCRTSYGCIGRCAHGSDKEYVGKRNGEVIRADSEAEFFEKLKQ